MTGTGPHPSGNEVSRPFVVLVAEDEVLIRMRVADDLVAAGYSVIEAASADEALDVLQAGLPVDVVFTDIQMPGTMDGLELTRIVRQNFPGIRVIVTSGHRMPSAVGPGADLAFVPKPYDPETILGLVARAQTGRDGNDDGDGAAARDDPAG